MRRNKGNGFLGTLGLVVSFAIEVIIFMIIFAFIGIIIQSQILVSFGFIISIIIALILNFLKVRPMIVYIVSLPVLFILLFFVPKILS
ncbi:MAG: hypothetical protein ACRC6T_04965 [Sarcina sp.]